MRKRGVTAAERTGLSVVGTRLPAFRLRNTSTGGGVANSEPKPGIDAAHHAPPSSTAAEQEAETRRRANAAMERYAAGDEAAFGELYRLTSVRLFQYLFRRTGDRVRADDLKQQTFLHMHQARARFLTGANVFPWMYAIAHRLVIDGFRRSGREVSFDAAESEPVCPQGAADELLIGRQLDERLFRAIATLPESQQAVIELRLEGLTYREIAEALGTTVSAVTSLLHRANTTLARLLAGAPD